MISLAISAALFAEGGRDQSQLRRLCFKSLLIIPAPQIGPAVIVISSRPMVLNMFGPGYGTGSVRRIVRVLSAFPDTISNIAVATLQICSVVGAAIFRCVLLPSPRNKVGTVRTPGAGHLESMHVTQTRRLVWRVHAERTG
jgi:hypothetical protein